MRPSLYYILLILFAFFATILDSSFASLFIIIVIIGWGIGECNFTKHSGKKDGLLLFGKVSLVYIVCAFLISRNYQNGSFFLVGDAAQSTYWLKLIMPESDYWGLLKEHYFELADKDALHVVGIKMACIWGNKLLGGATEFYLTLIHTAFGIMSIMSLYRILLLFYEPRKASKYAFIFALCSPFLYYSTVLIRDIIIAFCFVRGTEIVLNKYKPRGIICLMTLIIIATGIRLYSGLFMVSFVGVYLFKKVSHTRLKIIIIPVFVVLLVTIISAGILSNLYDQTIKEVENYQELDAGGSNGLSSRLLELPMGIKEVATFFYSQIMPFPFYYTLQLAQRPLQFFEAFTCIIYPVWWYFVFYSFFIFLIAYKGYKKLPIEINLFVVFSFVYILINTAQIDVRRMMHVYPFIFVLSLYLKNYIFNKRQCSRVYRSLGVAYLIMLLVYIIIKN